MAKQESYNCGFELTLEVVGGKWKGLILWHLYEKSVLRYGELDRAIPEITQKMLTQQLREMEQNKLVNRKAYNQIPPKVEYSLTQQGKKLGEIFILMKDWGVEYGEQNGVEILCKL
jgi:DNA-binding HxlR family transcriptional regulator